MFCSNISSNAKALHNQPQRLARRGSGEGDSMTDKQAAQDLKEETPAAQAAETSEVAPEPEAAAPEEKVETTPQEPKEEPKVEKEPVKEEKPEPSGKFKDLIKKIEELNVLELSELVKALEERFGVSAAAPMMMAGGAGGAGAAAEEAAEEKTSFTVVLAASGDQKIAVIKAVREINQELGLKEAKDLVEAAPKTVRENLNKEEAEVAKKKLEAAGAKVELK